LYFQRAIFFPHLTSYSLIADCIRTYTWDKKLETWIKDRGKNKPTITSPKDYRSRFRIAMAKYILQAPDCWHQFQVQTIQRQEVRLSSQQRQSGPQVQGQDGMTSGLRIMSAGVGLGVVANGINALQGQRPAPVKDKTDEDGDSGYVVEGHATQLAGEAGMGGL
jgi:hypothetical protein